MRRRRRGPSAARLKPRSLPMTFFRTAVVAGALAVAGVLSVAAPSCAQAVVAEIPAERPTAVSYGPQTVVRYRFGAKMTARGGSVQDVRLMVAVPLDCAEQIGRASCRERV